MRKIEFVAQLQLGHGFADTNEALVMPDDLVASIVMLNHIFNLREIGFE